jgi:hypothetical protein
MHKVSTRWGELEVRYYRTETHQGLSVPSVTVSLAEWCASKRGPPPVLMPIDLMVTGDWDRHLSMALKADIEAATYVPPVKSAQQPRQPQQKQEWKR